MKADSSSKPVQLLEPCAHCGTPTPKVEDRERVFCCNGCMGAHAFIHEMGLEDFYKLRSTNGNIAGVHESDPRNALLADLDAAGVRVNHLPGGLDCVRLSVEGMHCAACSWLIERMQPSIQGLQSARVRLSDNSVELIYDPKQTNVARVASRLSRIGYQLAPWQDDEENHSEVILKQREHWIGLALAAFLAANAMWIGVALYAGESTGISAENEYFLRWVGALLGLISAVIPGRIFFDTAWQAIKSRTPHVDIPIAISLSIGSLSAIYGAWVGHGHIYFDSLASFVLLLRIGRYLQFRAQSKARISIARLLRWNVNIAKRFNEQGELRPVPASRLIAGDRIQIEPGELIAADGVVVAGKSAIDMSLLTGESQPVLVEATNRVIGGTTNLTSTIQVQVEAAGEASRVGKLMSMVRDATTYRTQWIQAADRVGRWFVLLVLSLALATFVGWSLAANVGVATSHTMALLTIACPCALALAAPLVVTIALGRAAKRQIWIREGDCLEKLAKPGMLWIDKTGTLTTGRIHVHNWIGAETWLPMIGAVERSVHHPIATAISSFCSAYEDNGPCTANAISQEVGFGVSGIVDSHKVDVGNEQWMIRQSVLSCPQDQMVALGISALGQTPIWAAVDGKVVGFFAVGDSLRHDAATTLVQLQRMGWKLGLLSGDNAGVVDVIAESLREQGVKWEEVLSEQSPEGKLQKIQSSRIASGLQIAMVGDGINDAAALAAADIGIAIRGNSEQSLVSAPIYIASQKLSSILELFTASGRVVRAIRNCFVISLVYNTITISLAVAGWIHPLTVALFMPLSGVSVLVMAMQARTFSSNSNKKSPVIRLQTGEVKI